MDKYVVICRCINPSSHLFKLLISDKSQGDLSNEYTDSLDKIQNLITEHQKSTQYIYTSYHIIEYEKLLKIHKRHVKVLSIIFEIIQYKCSKLDWDNYVVISGQGSICIEYINKIIEIKKELDLYLCDDIIDIIIQHCKYWHNGYIQYK